MNKTISYVFISVLIALVLISIGCSKKPQNQAMNEYDKSISNLKKSHNINSPYVEQGSFDVELDQPRGICVDSKDNVYVVGDRNLMRYMSTGSLRDNILLGDAAFDVTVTDDDSIFIALQDKIKRFTSFGSEQMASDSRGVNARFVSISGDNNS